MQGASAGHKASGDGDVAATGRSFLADLLYQVAVSPSRLTEGVDASPLSTNLVATGPAATSETRYGGPRPK